MNKAHNTAMRRRSLSHPFQLALSEGLVMKHMTVLDYGCGRGDDVRRLQNRGYLVCGYDPHFFPGAPREPSDVVALNYVLNVIEKPQDRVAVLREAARLVQHLLIVAVRYDVAPKRGWKWHGDGFVTASGTFQKPYTPGTFQRFLRKHFDGYGWQWTLKGNVAFIKPLKVG